ncbi:hypothetical protein qdsa001_180 [Staphylococcus phage qdsa001]|nr:hypothetical protein qdsa001_180 [Staphylococcus phage qdsa001]QXV86194.1 hypothetical protein [Staphylococcus phage SAPYZU_15]BBM81354.1 hypothetical protein [Staphylococcus phage KSAP7]BBM81542.1 hypothetical protein [Staphylococcus phage KSAP11]BEU75304.1 hypothetical protein RNIID_0920 [Staphylococcus phage phiRNIID]
MSKKAIIAYVIILVMLALSISTYYVSSYLYHEKTKSQVTDQLTHHGKLKKDKNVEYVGDYTLKKVVDNKAYFMEKLPTYLPGRTSDKSIDMRYYRTSKFREGVNFKLIRVYTDDNDNNPVHKYRFEAVLNKK